MNLIQFYYVMCIVMFTLLIVFILSIVLNMLMQKDRLILLDFLQK